MLAKVCGLFVIVFFSIEGSFACNGYTLKLIRFKNCDENSVVKVPDNFAVTLDQDCNISYNGCVNVTKPIKTSPGTYFLKKPPLPTLEGDTDFCEAITQSEIPTVKDTLQAMGVPSKCPIPVKSYCSDPNKKVNISMFKNQLGLAAGTSTMKLTADHDSGKTCVELSFNINRARKG